MSSGISLSLDSRDISGKKVARLRQSGVLPSVVYGAGMDPLSTQSDFALTSKVVHQAGRHTPVNLTINGKKQLAIIKDIDFDPVRRTVRHVAFHAIKQNEKIVTTVPIVLTGEGDSPAERAGMVVLQALEEIEIRALPADLPPALEVSILTLAEANDNLTLADIILPKGVEYADVDQDLSLVIAGAHEPSALQAANEAAAGTAEDESKVESEKGGIETVAAESSEENSEDSKV